MYVLWQMKFFFISLLSKTNTTTTYKTPANKINWLAFNDEIRDFALD